MISIDLGSNSFRVLEYDCKNEVVLNEYEKIVKTADNIHKTGKISENSIDNILKAIKEAKKVINFDQEIVAYTTQALRVASNAQEVLDRFSEVGIDFKIIDSDQEAFFAMCAVDARLKKLKLQFNSFLLFDVGGGSSEIIYKDTNFSRSMSFDLGIVTATQKNKNLQSTKEYISSRVKQMKEKFNLSEKVDFCIGSSGTPTTIAALLLGMDYKTYDASKVNGYVLTSDSIQKAYDDLISLDEKERALKVEVGREDLILSGIFIIQEILKIFNFNSMLVIDDGVREGIAIDFCKNSLSKDI